MHCRWVYFAPRGVTLHMPSVSEKLYVLSYVLMKQSEWSIMFEMNDFWIVYDKND